MRQSRSLLLVGSAGLCLSTAQAMPPVMDRVPAEAMITIAVPNFAALQKDLKAVGTLVGQPGFADQIDQVLLMAGIEKGLKQDGSLAVVIMPMTKAQIDAGEEPDAIVLIPTPNYAELVGNFGVATPSGAIDTLNINGEEVFAKDLGEGFAALGPKKASVEAFSGKAGQMAAHKKLAGEVGDKLSDKADLSIVVNMQAVRPLAEKSIDEGLERIAGQAAAMGGGAAPNPESMAWIKENIFKDGLGMVAGLTIDNMGVSLDTTLSFAAGSKMAKALTAPGTSTGLISKLPAGPYLAVLALDTSAPERRALVREFADLAAKGGAANSAAAIQAKSFVDTIENSDGQAMMVGVSPGGLMGGLLVSSVSYVATKDPAAFVAQRKGYIKAMIDGKHATGKVEDNASEVNGKKVDSFEMRLIADPNNPFAAQGSMMMFGPAGGPSGFIAKAEGGVIETFAKNSQLLGAALNTAAKGENSQGQDKILALIGERLPANRVAEIYIGTKGILDTVMPMAAMFGGPQLNVDIPQDLPPVGLGITPNGGSVTASIYLPAPVLKTFGELAKQLQGALGNGENAAGDKPAARQPGF